MSASKTIVKSLECCLCTASQADACGRHVIDAAWGNRASYATIEITSFGWSKMMAGAFGVPGVFAMERQQIEDVVEMDLGTSFGATGKLVARYHGRGT
jgi:hypothetical protein